MVPTVPMGPTPPTQPTERMQPTTPRAPMQRMVRTGARGPLAPMQPMQPMGRLHHSTAPASYLPQRMRRGHTACNAACEANRFREAEIGCSRPCAAKIVLTIPLLSASRPRVPLSSALARARPHQPAIDVGEGCAVSAQSVPDSGCTVASDCQCVGCLVTACATSTRTTAYAQTARMMHSARRKQLQQ